MSEKSILGRAWKKESPEGDAWKKGLATGETYVNGHDTMGPILFLAAFGTKF